MCVHTRSVNYAECYCSHVSLKQLLANLHDILLDIHTSICNRIHGIGFKSVYLCCNGFTNSLSNWYSCYQQLMTSYTTSSDPVSCLHKQSSIHSWHHQLSHCPVLLTAYSNTTADTSRSWCVITPSSTHATERARTFNDRPLTLNATWPQLCPWEADPALPIDCEVIQSPTAAVSQTSHANECNIELPMYTALP